MADETKKELTEEEKMAELNGRVEEFNKELIPILKKYDLGLGATCFVNPNGTLGARPIMFDARTQPQPETAAPADAPAVPAEGPVKEA